MLGRRAEMPIKQASPKAKSGHVFGQARKPAKMFRAGLYARVSTNDQQTLPMQSRAMREYAARRGWTIAVQVREVNSGAARREARERLLEAARRREIDLVLVRRLDRWGRPVTDLLATLQELEHLGVGFVSLPVSDLHEGFHDRKPRSSILLSLTPDVPRDLAAGGRRASRRFQPGLFGQPAVSDLPRADRPTGQHRPGLAPSFIDQSRNLHHSRRGRLFPRPGLPVRAPHRIARRDPPSEMARRRTEPPGIAGGRRGGTAAPGRGPGGGTNPRIRVPHRRRATSQRYRRAGARGGERRCRADLRGVGVPRLYPDGV
ncbi:hypothetical protein SBA4_6300002 [Candidatus Sulfopaludibacter sp. SbA4]|nr:hypothetical protein SBA4_6300002 [Candidatus Sulfopaludibacter sp. SbA4]